MGCPSHRVPILKACRRIHFTGIGGSGMSALAQLLNHEGYLVSGSDRGYDRGRTSWLYQKLMRQGIRLIRQDGTQSRMKPDCMVMTQAVEEDNPEIAAARDLGIRVIKRPELLTSIVNSNRGVAISGSCGKSTTTAMVAQIAEYAGMNPTVLVGAAAYRYQDEMFIGNYRPGSSLIVAEVDESDGSVENFRPNVAVLTNISKDHFEPAQLINFFMPFLDGADLAVLNGDCHHSRFLVDRGQHKAVVYGQQGPLEFASFKCRGWHAEFALEGHRFNLPVPGQHNISNALCAIAAARALGISYEVCQRALSEFGGLLRRWNRVETMRGVDVIDDFAHSPAKIKSALDTAQYARGRVHAVFQPHGFGPTRFLWDDYVKVFARHLSHQDSLYLLSIFDAGGTANRTVSSEEMANAINGIRPSLAQTVDREKLVHDLQNVANDGDVVLVMGARDHSLTDLAREIAESLRS